MSGQVFHAIPAWVQQALPGGLGVWAPDISYFNGLYHLYYVGSRLHTQTSSDWAGRVIRHLTLGSGIPSGSIEGW